MTDKNQETVKFPRYGDVFDVAFDPVVGSEIGKRRPALIVSNDFNNEFSDTVTVLPFTSSPIKKVYPFEVSIPKNTAGLTQDSRIKADQIRTIDKKRLGRYRGSLAVEYTSRVEVALKIHLNIK